MIRNRHSTRRHLLALAATGLVVIGVSIVFSRIRSRITKPWDTDN